jgi:uncharacterized cupin superfamily protein
MPRVNIAAPEFTYDESDPEGFRSGLFRVGTLLGASATGASVYDVPPGQALCPYHYEYAEEEWLLVLEGSPTLRHPDGEEVLDQWDVSASPLARRGPTASATTATCPCAC